jgi:hypothetical protein
MIYYDSLSWHPCARSFTFPLLALVFTLLLVTLEYFILLYRLLALLSVGWAFPPPTLGFRLFLLHIGDILDFP